MVTGHPSRRKKPSPYKNALLASLPSKVIERIQPDLEVVPLTLKRILHHAGERIDAVYFPGSGFCSILSAMDDGRLIEVATVGREGVAGVRAAFMDDPSFSVTMVQGETDTCYRMSAQACRTEMQRHEEFHDLLMRFESALLGFIMQSTACNAVHSVEQRLARWLLHASDRMESNGFRLTQEFVAMMLGASRPTVTIVAGTLQEAGLITYRRGYVMILDREQLESAACECYRVATSLLGNVTRAAKKGRTAI